jgi:hypothetical protein
MCITEIIDFERKLRSYMLTYMQTRRRSINIHTICMHMYVHTPTYARIHTRARTHTKLYNNILIDVPRSTELPTNSEVVNLKTTA